MNINQEALLLAAEGLPSGPPSYGNNRNLWAESDNRALGTLANPRRAERAGPSSSERGAQPSCEKCGGTRQHVTRAPSASHFVFGGVHPEDTHGRGHEAPTGRSVLVQHPCVRGRNRKPLLGCERGCLNFVEHLGHGTVHVPTDGQALPRVMTGTARAANSRLPGTVRCDPISTFKRSD